MNYCEYTHNLKITLVNEDNLVYTDDILLQMIKDEITKGVIQHNIVHLAKQQNVFIIWNQHELNENDKLVMGDLFTKSDYKYPEINIIHIIKTLQKIKHIFNDNLMSKNIKIMYHIKNVLLKETFLYIKPYGII